MADRPHGTRQRYVDGPDINDQPGRGCRCADCRAATAQYARTRNRLIAYGRWNRGFIDAEPVRQHIRSLMAGGMTIRLIADLAGVSFKTICGLLYGHHGQPARRIRSNTATALLDTSPSRPTPRTTDSLGTRRRAQALLTRGWAYAGLARRCGLRPDAFACALRAGRISSQTAATIAAVYDQLVTAPPPVGWVADRARRTAARRGYPPPLAWDDDTIDDPTAQPAHDAPTDPNAVDTIAIERAISGDLPWTRLTAEERIAAYAELTARGWSPTRISRRFGLSGSTVRALDRGEPQPAREAA